MNPISAPEPLAALAMLALVLFAVGLELPTGNGVLAGLRPRGRALATLLGLQWLLLPALSLVALLWAVSPEWRGQGVVLGLTLAALLPGGKGALAFAVLAGAELRLVLASSFAALLLTPLLTPAWLLLALPGLSRPELPVLVTGSLLILAICLLPLLLGLAVARRWPNARRPLLRLSQVLVLLGVLLATAQAAAGLADIHPPGGWSLVLLAVVGHHLALLLASALSARALHLDIAERRAAVLAAGINNTALILPLTLLLAPGDALALATVALWGVWRLLAAAGLAAWWHRHPPPLPLTQGVKT